MAGSLQSHRGHQQFDELVKENAGSENNGELLPETCHGFLESWKLPVSCRGSF